MGKHHSGSSNEVPTKPPCGGCQHGSESGERDLVTTLRIVFAAVAAAFAWFVPGQAATVVGFVATLFCGFPIYKQALSNILVKRMTMELSMTIAIVAALSLFEVLTCLVIIFFVLVAEELERLAISRGRHSVRSLLELLPRTALKLEGGVEQEVDARALNKGDILIVKPGMRLAADATVISGHTYIDEASITGEAMPSEKTVGSRVYAGTINQSGAIEVSVDNIGPDTAYGKILQAVEDAEKSRANVQKIADRLAAYLVYFAIVMAAITFLVTHDINQTISVIIVAGACGIAAGTPLAILGAVGRAAQNGTVVKGGIYMEKLATIDTVVFDKTGTLTVGKPKVVSIIPAFGVTPETVLRIAASAETLSEHPIAQAVVAAAQEEGFEIQRPQLFNAIGGRGIACTLDGVEVVVGNKALMVERGVSIPLRMQQPADRTSEVFVTRGKLVIGRILVADSLRPEAVEMVKQLKELGIRVLLLSGDTPTTAAIIARQLGITEYEGGLRPDDKRARVAKLIEAGGKVAMVGDGVNDAPALMEATVGVAIGSGTDVAVESADVVLIGNDLLKFVDAVKIARQCRSIIYANFVGTLVIDALGMGFAFFGMMSPLLAAFVHVGSEILFLANSARLLPIRRKRNE